MSFLRMKESPSGAVIEIRAFAGMTLFFREDSMINITQKISISASYGFFISLRSVQNDGF